MVDTAFTELVGCPLPIQQAAMGGVTTLELAAAVSNAGGLGMVCFVMMPPEQVTTELDRLATMTSSPVGINFLMPFLDESVLEAAGSRCRVLEFFYGDPLSRLVDKAHELGALAVWQVGSANEARAAADAGCDLLVVQGCEAGGHVRGTVALRPLLDEVLRGTELPLVAAGGITTAEDVAAVLADGAAAARVGTRFVASAESDAHPDYVGALIEATGDETVLTETFNLIWPDAPHRVLRSCVEAAEKSGDEILGQTKLGGMTMPVPRFSPSPPTRATTGRIEAMALYAGQGVGSVKKVEPAGDIVRELARDLI